MTRSLAILGVFISCCIYLAGACGCYGASSCTVTGESVLDKNCSVQATGYCDCCQICNTCEQLYGGCLANQLNANGALSFSPAIHDTYVLNESLQTGYGCLQIVEPGEPAVTTGFGATCINPPLPAGLELASPDNTSRRCLIGSPTQVAPPTTYSIYVHQGSNFVLYTTVRFGVQGICTEPSTSTSSSSSSSSSTSTSTSTSTSGSSTCTTGNQRCATSETYQTCAHSVWSETQSCQPGLTCHQSGANIYCY